MRSTRWMIPIWTGIYSFLLILMPTPLALFSAPLLLIPAVIVYVLGHSRYVFVAFYGVGVSILFLIWGWGAWFLALYSLLMLAPAVMMGRLYLKGSSAKQVALAGTFVMTGSFVALYLILHAMYPNLLADFAQLTRESYDTLPSELKQTLDEDQIELSITMMKQMIPFMMFALSFAAVAVAHWVVRRICAGYGKKFQGFPGADQWMLPKSWVWYYFGALLIDLLVRPEIESYLTVVLWNLIPILMIAFTVQAFAFLSFVAKAKRWNRVIPFSVFVLFPFLPSVVSLLGVMDVAFPIRNAFRK